MSESKSHKRAKGRAAGRELLASLASNVARLRSARKLTQEELGELVGVSRLSISKIERGVSAPRATTLNRLAGALRVSLAELTTPVRELKGIRFRAEKKLKGRAQILARTADWLDSYRWLEGVVEDQRAFRLGKLRSRDLGPREMAARVRKALGIRDEPIRDICGLLEESGVRTLAIEYANGSFFGLSVAPSDGGPAVVVNCWERIPVERWIFSAAHELGHLLLHLDAYDVDAETEDKDEESEANEFAGHLLMPEKLFEKEWEETAGLPFIDRVLKVKRMFRVSYKTVLTRLTQTKKAPDDIWGVFRERYARTHGKRLTKKVEPKPLVDADFGSDRLHRLVRSAFENGKLSLGRGAEILGLPLSGMRELANEWSG